MIKTISLSLVLCILLPHILKADEYSPGISFVLKQIRTEVAANGLPLLEGRSHSYGGTHGAFYLLAPYIFARASSRDVLQMINDQNPIVRIMAVRRILAPGIPAFKRELLNKLDQDTQVVFVGPLGGNAVYKQMTVREVVQALKADPCFLESDE